MKRQSCLKLANQFNVSHKRSIFLNEPTNGRMNEPTMEHNIHFIFFFILVFEISSKWRTKKSAALRTHTTSVWVLWVFASFIPFIDSTLPSLVHAILSKHMPFGVDFYSPFCSLAWWLWCVVVWLTWYGFGCWLWSGYVWCLNAWNWLHQKHVP